jgi:pectate lyase
MVFSSSAFLLILTACSGSGGGAAGNSSPGSSSNIVVSVTGVTVKSSTSILVSGTESLYPVISPDNATNKNVTWKSSNSAYATVDSSGQVKGIAAGSATITATTADGNKTADCVVTVFSTVTNVTSVTLDQSSLALSAGNSQILTATINPSSATNQNLSWSSSNTSAATVDQTGRVTALFDGTSTITVTTADGAKTATCTVTVKFGSLGADGWATASGSGAVTGGDSAIPANIYTVTTRAQLVSALNSASSTAKIIYVSGTINLCVDDSNVELGESDFITQSGTSYSISAYVTECTGLTAISTGPQETNRKTCMNLQKARVILSVGSNTSIIGLGSTAKFVKGNLSLSGKDNIVIRNIAFEDAYDYFPQWDPTDGTTGNWNSQFDLISVSGSTRVWIDHCTFSDGSRLDSTFPLYFGREYQHHDALVDLTNAADYCTLSYNYFHDHDKTHLVGSSDSATADIGKLKITFHHNLYENTVQRCPRIRYGQVHVYDNYYKSVSSYCIGIGVSSSVFIESNYFESGVTQLGWYASSSKPGAFQDVNNSPALSTSGIKYSATTVAWSPATVSGYTFKNLVDAASDVPLLCTTYAGAGKPVRP